MKHLNKLLSLLLALLMVVLCAAPAFASASKDEVIRIYDAEDLVQLSRQCTLDSWSQGKTVLLMQDIDLTGSDFQPIPTFGGTFSGQGYSIKGLTIPVSGDTVGLFRYIQTEGVVSDLTVCANPHLNSTQSILGGIAGSNSGTISRCAFLGDLRGKSSVGGVVGINQQGGQIINCTYNGILTAEHYAGGIAGQNFGSIIQCENRGAINTTEVKSTTNLEDIDLGQLNSTENSTGCTDIGGIVGFSAGIVQSCHNYGNVGYPHIGYNVGGIAGRQNGYMDSCTNSGSIFGRKDVGGIVGQVEPQTILKYDDSTLNSIWTELDALEKMLDTFLTDTGSASDRLSDRIQGVSDSASDMKDAVSDLADAFTHWADSGLDQINDLSARLSWVLERTDPIMDTVEQAINSLESAADLFSEGFSQTGTAMSLGGDVAEEMSLATEDMELAVEDGKAAIQFMNDALALLKAGLGDRKTTEQNLDLLSGGITALSDAFTSIAASVEQIRVAMDSVYTWITTDPAWAQLKESVSDLSDALEVISMALSDISSAIEQIVNNEDFAAAMELMASGTQKLLNGAEDLAEAMGFFADAYEDFQANGTFGDLSEGFGMLADAAQSISDGAAEIRDAITILQESDELSVQMELLKEALTKLSEGLEDAEQAYSAILDALELIEGSSIPEETLELLEQELANISAQLTIMSQAAEEISTAIRNLNDNLNLSAFEAAFDNLLDAGNALNDAAEDLSNAIDHMGDAMDLIEDAADRLKTALDTFSDGTAALENALSLLEQAVADFDSIVEELAAMPEIKFDSMDEALSEESSDLDSAADDLIEQFNKLNAAMREESDLLIEDLKALNTQVGSIVDLVHQLQLEQEENESEDRLEDVSHENADGSRSTGKVSACVNSGTVEGDLNVAGIAGSIAIEYDFDPEDDLTITGSRTLNSRYLVRAVIYGSINRGEIIGKKDSIGGIVGSMDFGQVSHCQGYGSVSSTAGSYVGGIAGTSYGTIDSCWAMCVLSGDDYVGGIAGLGSAITDCRTLVEALEPGPRFGAIAGQVEEDAQLSGNQFVHRLLAGVDGVSYAGKAEPVSYDELCNADTLPADFTAFELVFTAEGTVVAVIPFRYGDALEELPAIPEKAGHSAAWPELDYSYLSFSHTLEARYTPFRTALSDGEAVPNYLVSGNFDPDAAVSVTSETASWQDSEGVVHSGTAYTVTVSGGASEDGSYTLHWRIPDEEACDLWVLHDGTWVKQTYTPDGSYLLLSFNGEAVTFCLIPQGGLNMILLVSAAGVFLLIFLAAVFLYFKKRNRRAKAVK